ncbi:hypothetical protein [Natrarchaeobius oligotrophus]|uniref:Uncharacterized protein n=1 Tax=Natrarchaeobius chitinivorans TaxID=1679083 RepID=A0A3N6PN23_NATCH|nr:hypothetical protein [Natrarchaeobius chitinivorans]RQH00476.1 hypothetical protein EA472_11590 [Natrarchaeobius chitinivorans]
MGRRYELPSSPFERLRQRVRSALEETRETAGLSRADSGNGSERSDGGGESSGNLFHCSTCGSVYIASEKRVCAKCDQQVEQVSSTFTHQRGAD